MTVARRLGEVHPRALQATRIDLHHAALLVSAVGRSLAAREPGFRHAALSWSRRHRSLAGWPVQTPDGTGLRAILTFVPPAIEVRRATPGQAATVASIPLAGLLASDAVGRLREVAASAGLDPGRFTVRTPADLPPGPIDTGERFAPDAAAAAELGAWFAFADERLAATADAHGVPLPVPCWADHFDLAVVVPVRGEGALPDAQLTMGFSPGDPTIPEPYLYVTRWPLDASRVAEVAPPAGGRWQIEGWLGLAMSGAAILAATDRDATAARFLREGFEIAAGLLRAG